MESAVRKFTFAVSVAFMLFTLGIVTTQSNATEGDGKPVAAPLYRVTYKVDDLAVWSENGTKFDTSILESFLKLKTTEVQWGTKHRFEPYSAERMLVVNSTAEVHKTVSACLQEMRERKK